jgi:hypothetical protein
MLHTILLPLIITAYSLNDSMPANYAGIKMGPNYSFFIKDEERDEIINSPRFGSVFGVYFNQNIGNSGVGFREEILINNKNFHMIEFGTPLDISVRTITIPILLRFRDVEHKLQFNFNMGASVELITRCVVGLYENNKYVIHSSDFFTPITFGIPIGFSFDYLTDKGILSAEFRNTIDITHSTGIERFDVLCLLIGYGFAYPNYQNIRLDKKRIKEIEDF